MFCATSAANSSFSFIGSPFLCLFLQKLSPRNSSRPNVRSDRVAAVRDQIQDRHVRCELAVELGIWNLLVVHILDRYAMILEKVVIEIFSRAEPGYVDISS